MINLFKSLFLTTDRAGKNIEMVSKGLDAVFHTKEEKANLLLAWVKATGPTNVSRRVVAFTVAIIWAIYHLAFLALTILAIWFDLHDVITLLDAHMSASINGSFMLVMVFYFAPHALAAMKPAAIKDALK